MQNIIVTGGAGYIGSHTCKVLKQSGFNPITFDNLVHGHKEFVKWGPLEIGDITNRNHLDRVFDLYKPCAVVHFAAFAYVGESVQKPGKYYKNNFCGTLNLLEAMKDHNIKNIVFSSTCSTYGNPVVLPISEEHVQNPINPYGSSKLMIERMLSDFDFAYKIKSVSLRYFNASGADFDGEIGEYHSQETHLIPLVIFAALKRISFINVFGNDYDTHDGTAIRDYIHVNDLANAHVLALQYLLDGGESDQFNLGTGRGYSVLEIINKVKVVSKREIDVRICEKRLGDPAILVAQNKKICEKLGWKPNFDLDQIIESALKWHESQIIYR